MSRFARYCRTYSPFFIAGVIATTGLTACVEEGVQWTARERQNTEHIFNSLEATSKAAQLANQLPVNASASQRAPVARQLEIALREALRVKDTVLEKSHPQMWGKFRGVYQPALKQLLQYYRTGHKPRGTKPAQAIREFNQWFSTHQYEFRW
ncbi:MAG TPA: hypothetical protein VFP95_04245 [Gammaproteobacteria bacterium]|nr:hypothetical protein [Gammaproteobacteria bacterium]